MSKRVGILALQGAFVRHREILEALGTAVRELREGADLAGLDALVIPGGESTTISMMIERGGLIDPLKDLIFQGWPVFGTCAGLILLARRVEDWDNLPRPAALDIKVLRNAYGRQLNSFEADLDIPVLGKESFRGVFIRAPHITAWGKDVDILAEFEDHPVLVRQGALLGAAFHPELTGDHRLHRYFLEEVVG